MVLIIKQLSEDSRKEYFEVCKKKHSGMFSRGLINETCSILSFLDLENWYDYSESFRQEYLTLLRNKKRTGSLTE